jgi:pantothenate kinase
LVGFLIYIINMNVMWDPNKSFRRGSMANDKILPVLKSVKRRTVFTKGKPSWFNTDGEKTEECYVIGIAGGSASGKTSVAKVIFINLFLI